MKTQEETITHKASENTTSELETITLGEGCFWCSEAYFLQLKGVKKVVSGYSGGNIPNPTYEEVCSGTTGYAEVSQITFDPSEIGFDKLLEAFWSSHDPTTLNRQGNDVGPQYRSVIFYHNQAQKEAAEAFKEELNSSDTFSKPIVTIIEPFTDFHPAENYLQDFYENHPNHPYCRIVINPKLKKFKKKFADELK